MNKHIGSFSSVSISLNFFTCRKDDSGLISNPELSFGQQWFFLLYKVRKMIKRHSEIILFAILHTLLLSATLIGLPTGQSADPPEYLFLTVPERQQPLFKHGDPGWIGKLARRGRKEAGPIALQSARPDKFHAPVLLGSFSDRTGSHTARDFQNHLFDSNPSGTVSEYFLEVSSGMFELEGKVYGWFQTGKQFDYYMANGVSESAYPQNIPGFVAAVISLADPHVDFGLYDNDGMDNIPNSGDDDGYVDAVVLVFAGLPGLQSTRGLQGRLENPVVTSDQSASGGNIRIRSFVLVPELQRKDNTAILQTIGTTCHEFGHVLGLPDLYDYSGRSLGLGWWCLMSEGAHLGDGSKPPHLSAWCKMQLGWVNPVIVGSPETLRIEPVIKEPVVYKIWEDGYGLSRFFLLENRQKELGFDSLLPGSGLLIYHVDENRRFGKYLFGWGALNSDFEHKLVDLEEADHKRDLDYSISMGDAGDPFPGSSGNQRFNDNTNPSSRDYSGNATGVAIEDIVVAGRDIIARITPREMIGYGIIYDSAGITGNVSIADIAGQKIWSGVRFTSIEAGVLQAVDIGIFEESNGIELKTYVATGHEFPGKLVFSDTIGTLAPGWHTVELGELPPRLQANQDFLVTCGFISKLPVDTVSKHSGRSYISGDGISYVPFAGKEQGNFSIRARIRTTGSGTGPVSCDFNRDRVHDILDAIALLKFIRENPGDLSADFNLDGRASVLDVLALLVALSTGACPE